MNQLIDKINDRSAVIGIVGMGYVGLPLAMAFSEKYCTIGFDINDKIIHELNIGNSTIKDVSDEVLRKFLNKTFIPTSDYISLRKCDFIIICVPTPLTHKKDPDLSYIINACKTVLKILKKNQFIILESTTYPGTTIDVVVPILEEGGLKAGTDFGVAYSPERIDPGNIEYTIQKMPKVVGGINENDTYIASKLYGSVITKIIKVKDTQTAESVKMLENIFRNVNIALVNEFALLCEKMGVNVWEVIAAASTKPYGFTPFYPGPGVGGHCIPLDPYYMSYKAKRYGVIPKFIETSGEINDFMRIHTVNLIEIGLSKVNKKLKGSTIAVCGLSYKKNIDDTRESPSITVIDELTNNNAIVKVYDPFVKSINTNAGEFKSEKSLIDVLKYSDCAVFMVDHDEFKDFDDGVFDSLNDLVVVDCKNIFGDTTYNLYFGIGNVR